MYRIRELRKERGLTLKELGAKLGLGEMAISNYETGKRQPSVQTINRLADLFGVTTDYLLERTNDRQDDVVSAAGPPPADDPEMVFAASLKDGLTYDDLTPEAKGELYKYYQYLKIRYPKDE